MGGEVVVVVYVDSLQHIYLPRHTHTHTLYVYVCWLPILVSLLQLRSTLTYFTPILYACQKSHLSHYPHHHHPPPSPPSAP
ncbi:unnamed protein product [Rodentolepis nana]|uniref:G-protein coupled receptors family 1 profile domain-containing protein n=1 Tax=Rodentolepis nana TaxID=102285 RepID=A0A0R3TBI8_RODNA|nr:unnamed protein product [Rodentolepis nana]